MKSSVIIIATFALHFPVVWAMEKKTTDLSKIDLNKSEDFTLQMKKRTISFESYSEQLEQKDQNASPSSERPNIGKEQPLEAEKYFSSLLGTKSPTPFFTLDNPSSDEISNFNYEPKVIDFLTNIGAQKIEKSKIIYHFHLLTSTIPEQARQKLANEKLTIGKYFLHEIVKIAHKSDFISGQKVALMIERLAYDWNANVNVADWTGKRILHRLAQNQRIYPYMIIRNLVENHEADVNAKDNFGRTPLHYAALVQPNETTYQVVAELLNQDADPNIQDQAGETPAHIAARMCRRKEMIDIYTLSAAKTNNTLLNEAQKTHSAIFDPEEDNAVFIDAYPEFN